jgi:rod shape-determining protein MreC
VVRRGARGGGRVDGVVLAVALLLSVVARALPTQRSDVIAGALRRTVLAPLYSLQQRTERARRVLLSHDSVTVARDSVLLRALDAGRLEIENDRLRMLLGLGARLRDGFVAAEAMHGPALGEEHTLVLNAGTNAHVVPFSAVIAPEGIVGYVRSADALSSIAIVWPHPDFRVSAMTATGSAVGMVLPHLGEGAARSLLELRGVPARTVLAAGTLIVSSGIGGTFPRGIPVGRILREIQTAEGWERNYLVMPAVHPADVGTVLILLPGRTNADVRTIWSVPDSAVTAAKRAVSAGDSLAKAGRDSVRRMP